MLKRKLEDIVRLDLLRSPVVALMGPRQVGKSTLALDIMAEIPAVYIDLENRLDLEKVKDIVAFHNNNSDKLIILDEMQRLPEIFTEIRGIVDTERRKGNKVGQFLFLGSASLELLKQSSESLAGRISYLELFPIDVLEYADADLDKMNALWLKGGFPESLLAKSDKNSLSWRRDFIKTYLERDIPQLGPRIPSETLERFWTMLAHNQGTVLNAAHLARNLDVSGVTIARYLDLMVDLLLVKRLKPWTLNAGKRLVRSPKIYVRDSGLTHALLNINSYNELLGHPVVGGSWEGFVIENIMSVIPFGAQTFYYGTPGGAEIDLIIEFNGQEKWAIEIKRSSTPSLKKGFYIACEDVQPTKRYVIYAGKDTFTMQGGVIASSLYSLMQEIVNYQS
ncbi:ATP-binding protein [Pedobacter frigidisoli]|uniref:ATP-binding protein n=1 Tax=Pedobacter frigidisoli TaxID=2530455 RepID=A0A4V6N648_9SPHI|nr:ATP-binding protein [Pedobacter frigidisoli]TCD04634.1 ATP-binding protein [Pedobacter frigidisoli]